MAKSSVKVTKKAERSAARGTRDSAPSIEAILPAGGELGRLIRAFDWSQTPLGPIARWPQSLKTAVRIILNSRYAMFVWWGQELISLYNDPYRAFLGIKHPDALGKSAREVWAEIWDQIGPRTDKVLLRGESTFDEALLLPMERHGYLEETYFTFSYSPLPDDEGNVGGLFCAVTEETQQVIGGRRLTLLRDIAAAMAEGRTSGQVCQSAVKPLSRGQRDLPFSLIYLLEPDGNTLRKASASGIEVDHPAAPASISLTGQSVWPFQQVIETGVTVLVENLGERIAELPTGEWSEPPQTAVLAPIARQGQSRPAGVFVAGLNPYRKFDDEFKGFVLLLSNQIAGAIANASAYEEERKRAESLAELDRAKTAFFSNVSHEFRTPLTLMLGPVEDILAKPVDQVLPEDRKLLTVAHRSGLRLQKLVNGLLDFSRIEAGRVQASFEPTDLAALTTELASVFRSAVERAGLKLVVYCEPLPEPVYVDREMWEKVVLNLLSNAFKFTFNGEIEVVLRPDGGRPVLTVRDTGTGISKEELPRLFERFHRIEGAKARTYEGSGIGLALVQELVRIHGGEIKAASKLGEGTTFSVTLPFGAAHLPAGRISARRTLASTATRAAAYVQEAMEWIPGEESGLAASDVTGDRTVREADVRILLADDNADMRDYVGRLLGARWTVETVGDGVSALAAIRESKPTLVITDVMMPGLDGFGLLRELRKDPATRSIPVIMLSARAGEESRVEGLEAGADDYVVKPFSARELLARVATRIELYRAEQTLRESEERFRSLFNSTPMAVFVCDREGVIQHYNPRAVELWGREPKRGVERHCGSARLFLPDGTVLPHEQSPILEVLRTGTPVRNVEVLIERPDGSRLPVLVSFAALMDAGGQISGAVASFIDISDRKQAEQQLRATNEELGRFNRMTVGRELRMIELKKEVNELCERLGQPPRYRLEFEPDRKNPEGSNTRDAAGVGARAQSR